MAENHSKRGSRKAVPKHPGVYYMQQDSEGPHPPYHGYAGRVGGKQVWLFGNPPYERIEDAKAAIVEARGDMATGIPVVSSRDPMPEAIEAWIAKPRKRDLTEATKDEYRRMAKDWILPVVGRKRVSQFERADVIRIIANAKGKLAPSTMKRLRTILSGTLTEAGRDFRAISVNVEWPSEQSRSAKAAKMRKLILTREEIARLLSLDYQAPWIPVMFETLIFSGLRIGEALGLRWMDVDLQQGCIIVRGQVPAADQTRTYKAAAKMQDEGAERTVWVDETLIEALRAYRKEQFAQGRVKPEGFVFAQRDGRPRQYNKVYDRLQSALDRAGLARRGPHKLRHTYVSMLIANGAQVSDVQEALGHADQTTTLREYQWLWDDPGPKRDRIRAALAAARGA